MIFRTQLGQHTCKGPSLVSLRSDYVNVNLQFCICICKWDSGLYEYDSVNTTTVVVLSFCIIVYDILVQLQDLGSPMSEKAGKESQYGFASHPST